MDVKELIKKDESGNIERKSSISQIDEIIETISAFSNTKGGTIFIGVTNNGRVIGIEIGKDTIERVSNRIIQNTDPKVHPEISVEEIDKKKIIRIEVKESTDKLVLAFGRPYKRTGKSTLKMSKEEYERLILEKHKGKLQFDNQICKNAEMEDIDKKKVNWYLKKREEIRKIKKPKDMPFNEILLNIDAVRKDGKLKPTNSGILFFSRNPQRFFVQSQLRVVKFKGTKVIHSVIDRIDCSGTLWEMIEQAEEFIRKNIRLLSFRTEKSFMREDKFEYPIRALREAMINALIHRNYLETADTRVFIFDDRIEILNPGSFPNDVTPEKPMHKPVNPILSRLMYDIGFIEKYGSGIYMMKELCRKWENKEPRYELHPIETKIIFESQVKESTVVEIEEGILKGLNKRQRKAIEYIKEKGKISRSVYCRNFGVGKTLAHRELQGLVSKNLITQRGAGRSTHYIIY